MSKIIKFILKSNLIEYDCWIQQRQPIKLNLMGLKLKLLITLVFLIFSSYYYFSQEGDFESLQTSHKFRIYKDEHGIPRVYAKDRKSALYGLGFAQAQDRLWTLHLKKRIVQGRLSEIFGAGALPLDMQNRNYDFYGVGKMNLKVVGQQEKEWAQAYCDGINDYAKSTRMLPFEFYLTFSQWEDWQVEDILSMVSFLSFVLQFDWIYEIARQRLLETVGFDLAWKLMPFGDDNLFRQVTIMNNDELKKLGRYKQYNSSIIQEVLRQHWIKKTPPIGSVHMPATDYDSLGSNAWIIGGNHTKNGKPLLANDPHLGLIIPSLFYMAEINIVDQNNQLNLSAFGSKAEGIPAISIGINNNFAWGSTAAYIDNKDVFHETVREQNGRLEYLYKNEWHAFIKRKQVFKIRGSDDFVKQFYHTHRGPVIEHLFMDLHVKYGFPIPNQYRINHTLTLSSAIYDPDYNSLRGLSLLAFAQTFQEFQKASSLIQTPNIDSAWIAKDGSYGYGAVGRIPKRVVPEMGGFVKDGTTDLYDMGEYLNWDEMPKLRNPQKGYVAMANNKFAEDSFDTRGSIHELSTGRSYRLQKIITEKIKNNYKFNHKDMMDMQLDTRDQFLSEALPLLLNALDTVRYIWETAQTAGYYDLLRKWDYHMPVNSVQTSIYHVFEHQFHESLLHGTSLSEQQREAILNHAFFQVYFMKLHERIGAFNLTQQQAFLCSNNQSRNYTQVHPCLANAALAFKKLPKLLKELFGSTNVNEYHWGKIHKHIFKSVPWSQIPVLRSIWGREVATGGNSRSLNVAILTHQTKSYNSIAGSVFRLITDMNETYFSYDTGESDRVTSKFYDNFLGKDMYVKYEVKNPIKGQKVNWKLLVDRLN